MQMGDAAFGTQASLRARQRAARSPTPDSQMAGMPRVGYPGPPTPHPMPPQSVSNEFGTQAALRARRKAEREYGGPPQTLPPPPPMPPMPPMPPPQTPPAATAGDEAYGSQAALRARRKASRAPPVSHSLSPHHLTHPAPAMPPHVPPHEFSHSYPTPGSQAELRARRAAARRPGYSHEHVAGVRTTFDQR